MTILTNAMNALHKRSNYLRTKHELESMSQRVAVDLGMFREDASIVAHRAVYGN